MAASLYKSQLRLHHLIEFFVKVSGTFAYVYAIRIQSVF